MCAQKAWLMINDGTARVDVTYYGHMRPMSMVVTRRNERERIELIEVIETASLNILFCIHI